jgi:3-hydroxy-3-methylglutaryl CoA synthase
VGLGQTSMAFTGDREDINSICLTGAPTNSVTDRS